MSARKNLLLVIGDAVRRDALGCYGSDSGVTPNLDRFAAGATVCADAYAASSWTLASMASMFTSTYPGVHQLRMTAPRSGGSAQTDTLHSGLLTLAEVLSTAGYQTRCIVANPWLRQFFRVTRGFDRHTYFWKEPAETLMAAWEAQLGELAEPWFVYLHFMDCHAPFTIQRADPHGEGRFHRYTRKIDREHVVYGYFKRHFRTLQSEDIAALRELYREELRHLDDRLAPLLAPTGDRLVIFTADHGEMLGERGYHPLVPEKLVAFGHNKTPYEPLVKVPLVVRDGDRAGGARLSGPVSHVDLMPTVLDLLGVQGPADQMQGRSFAAALASGRSERTEVFTEKLDDEYFPYEERAVIRDGWKYFQIARPLERYLVNELVPRWHPVNHRFEDAYELLGYTLDNEAVPRGGTTRLILYWRALHPLKPRLMGMVFFVSQRNRAVPFVARFYPVHGTLRPEHWEPGRIVEDPVAVMVPPEVPPGDYALRLGLFDLDARDTGTAEDAFHGGSRVTGVLTVTDAPPPDQPPPVQRGRGWRRALAGALFLCGLPLRAGIEGGAFRPGDAATVRLTWLRPLPLAVRYGIRLEWRRSGRPEVLARQEFRSRGGILDRIALWFCRSRTVEEAFALQIPPALPEGEYGLTVSVYPLRAPFLANRSRVECAQPVRIVSTERPQFIHNSLELVGFDLQPARPVPGEPVAARLMWKHHPECGAVPPMSLELRLQPAEEKTGISHPFRVDVPGAGNVRSWVQELELTLPSELTEGPCAICLAVVGGGPSRRIATAEVWGRGREPNEVLREELYNLTEDPGELTDRTSVSTGRLESLRPVMERYVADNRQRARKYQDRVVVEVDAEIQRQLSALGYFDHA